MATAGMNVRLVRAAALFLACASAATAWAGSPKLSRISPPGGQRGATVEAYLTGQYLEQPKQILIYEPGLTLLAGKSLLGQVEINGRKENVEPGTRVRIELKIAEDCPLGAHGLRLRTANGITEYVNFFVGPFPTVEEDEQKRNDKRESAKAVPLNCTVNGRLNDPADVDSYRIQVKRGQRISAEIEAARIGAEKGIPDLHLAILDADGKTLLEADDSALFIQDPVLSLLAPSDGAYFVQVRHSIYNANGEIYRLHVGDFPRPTGLYPAGGQAGSKLKVQVLGDPRGAWSTVVPLPDQLGDFPFAVIDPSTKVSAPSPNKLRVSPFANVLETEPNDSPDAVPAFAAVEFPRALNGIIEKPGDVDCFRFKARKGERFKIHALANALGSPLDPTIWIKPAGPKANGPTQRATDSKPNQLGIPPIAGSNRDTLDPVLEFTVPADGEYVLGVEDDRGAGGVDYIYRVECTRETDAVYAYIAPEPDNQQTPQLRQAVSVASGNRYNAQLAIFNTNQPFNGELEIFAVGLPEGVTMSAARLLPGITRVPVVFAAAAGVKPQGKFIDLVAKPVGEGKQPELASGYRQVMPMNLYGNEFYLHAVVDKLAIAVTDPAPFSIRAEDPHSALVQNGETAIPFKIWRAADYKAPIAVSMEWKPTGVTSNTPVTIPADKTTGEYLIGAAKNATPGSYSVTLTATASAERAKASDTGDRIYVASQAFQLTVAEPHLEGKFARTSIERGKTAPLVCKLNHLKPFAGAAKATLSRLPRGVELVEKTKPVKSDDKEITFNLRATDDCLVGSYQGIVLDVTVTEDGQPLRQLSGYGMLRIDAERGARASVR